MSGVGEYLYFDAIRVGAIAEEEAEKLCEVLCVAHLDHIISSHDTSVSCPICSLKDRLAEAEKQRDEAREHAGDSDERAQRYLEERDIARAERDAARRGKGRYLPHT